MSTRIGWVIFEGDWVLINNRWAQVSDIRIFRQKGESVSQCQIWIPELGLTWIDAEGKYCRIQYVECDSMIQETIKGWAEKKAK